MGYLYRYLFYKILLLVYWVKTKDTQEWSAMLLLSMLVFINAVTIYFIAKGNFVPNLQLETPVNFCILMGLIMVANYFYFINHDKFKAIIKEFEEDSESKKLLSTAITLIYIIITIYSLFIFGNTVREMNLLNRQILSY